MGKSGSVSCRVTVPFFCILAHTGLCVCVCVCVCVPSESLSPVLCKFWRLYDWVNGDLLQEGLCLTQVCSIQIPYPCSRPLLTCASTGDPQTLKGRSDSVSVDSLGAHKILFEPSGSLWLAWGLILNVILPLLLSYWVFSFALGCGVCFSFLVGSNILLSDSCSAVSCIFGVLSEDEHTSFYSAILD